MPPPGRARWKRAALRAGVGVPLRAVKRRFDPAHVRRDRADHARLRRLLAEVLRPDSGALDVGCRTTTGPHPRRCGSC